MESQAGTALRHVGFLRGLSAEALEDVAGRCVFRNLPENRILFRRGQPCEGMFVVVEGRIRVYRSSSTGKEQVLHTQEPGQSLAEVPLFDAGPYPASARALEDSRLLVLPIGEFQRLYRSNPEIAEAIIRGLGRRLRRAVGLIEKISLRSVPARVALTLREHAEAADAFRIGGTFELNRTQEELAAELATTRESVARALGRFRKRGLIEQQGSHVRILEPEGLEQEATTD